MAQALLLIPHKTGITPLAKDMKMKKLHTLMVGFFVLGLFTTISCSSKQAETTPVAVSVEDTQRNIVAEKERQIADLERRLDEKRDTTHGAKFGNMSRSQRAAVNAQYAQLRTVKGELEQLRATNTPEDFNRRQMELERSIAALDSSVNRLAE